MLASSVPAIEERVTFMHISNKLNAPLCAIPSSRLLKFCRFAFLTVFFSAFFPLFSSATNSLPHGVHSNPPSGPSLLYGVTVNRLLQISQFASWPGNCLLFSIKSASSRKSSSSSSSLSSSSLRAFFLAAAFSFASCAAVCLRLRPARERSITALASCAACSCSWVCSWVCADAASADSWVSC